MHLQAISLSPLYKFNHNIIIAGNHAIIMQVLNYDSSKDMINRYAAENLIYVLARLHYGNVKIF